MTKFAFYVPSHSDNFHQTYNTVKLSWYHTLSHLSDQRENMRTEESQFLIPSLVCHSTNAP